MIKCNLNYENKTEPPKRRLLKDDPEPVPGPVDPTPNPMVEKSYTPQAGSCVTRDGTAGEKPLDWNEIEGVSDAVDCKA